MVSAVSRITAGSAPSPMSCIVASCAAPAKMVTDMVMAWAADRPWPTAVSPATMPNGATPGSMGATASMPVPNSSRRLRMGPSRDARPGPGRALDIP